MTTLYDLIPKERLIQVIRENLSYICEMEDKIKILERKLSEERRNRQIKRTEAEAVQTH